MSLSLDINSSLLNKEVDRRDEPSHSLLFPRLACQVTAHKDNIVLSRDGLDFHVKVPSLSVESLHNLLLKMDGTRSINELQNLISSTDTVSIETIVENLEQHVLLDEADEFKIRSGISALLELEDLINELLYKFLYKNVFWQHIQSPNNKLPINVLYGLAIENYHFLFRESYFDSPVLGYQSSTKVRLLMNEFYCEEYGHDELVLRALNSIGISREDLMDTMPLPETMAMCNALAYWANFDPLFFFTTLGVLEGKNLKKVDSYIEACDLIGLDSSFVDPLRQHANINLKGEHGNLTRCIFQEIPYIDEETMQRFKSQTYLFIEMYNNFYTSVWNYYSSTDSLLRRVSAI